MHFTGEYLLTMLHKLKTSGKRELANLEAEVGISFQLSLGSILDIMFKSFLHKLARTFH